MWGVNYGEFKEFEKAVLYKRIVEWNEDKLVLEDGTEITIVESEQSCCASAGGAFEFPELKVDGAITNVVVGEVDSECEWGETTNSITITFMHNQNEICRANASANDGNGGYYYSVASFLVKDVHYEIVEA